MATFESMDRRMPKIEACLKANGLESLDACNEMLLAKGIDCDKIVRGVQPICFDNAVWAYTLGTAIAVKRGLTDAAKCAAAIGEGLEAFTIPGSVAEQRQVGLGHGNLGARLLSEDTTCFAFLAGHESFAAAEGAIGIARTANKVRKTPLRVILNGLGKDAAYIISRINGFTYVQTEYDIPTQTLTVVKEIPFSEGERAAVKCYGANDVMEGVAIMKTGRIFFVCEIVQFCNQFFWIPFYQFVEKTPAEYRRVIEVLANEFGQLLFQIFFKCSRFSSISYKRYFGPNQQTFFIT